MPSRQRTNSIATGQTADKGNGVVTGAARQRQRLEAPPRECSAASRRTSPGSQRTAFDRCTGVHTRRRRRGPGHGPRGRLAAALTAASRRASSACRTSSVSSDAPRNHVRRPRLHLHLAHRGHDPAALGGQHDLRGAAQRIGPHRHRRRAGMTRRAVQDSTRIRSAPAIRLTTPTGRLRDCSTGPCSMCVST